ncbi:unnamed protein product [Paramecium sonneborni]|uniref:Uncharacterized protein n=1 Tax=Paramecium sonneborni TaxID=65129 RepID=A0A8S1MVE4_9CILI|nr:unnamed protein product [Paramecium sonneborni]
MISEIIFDGIVKQIINQVRKLINQHQIDAKSPSFLDQKNVKISIKTMLDLIIRISQIFLDDQEYNIRPTIDSFQARSKLKQYFASSYYYKQIYYEKTLLLKINRSLSYKFKRIKTHLVKQTRSIINLLKQMNVNNNNRQSLIIKQQVRDLIKNMFVDNFNENGYRKKIQQQAQNLEKEMKQCDKSFLISKSIDNSNLLNQTSKSTTASQGQRRPQYIQKNDRLNITSPQFKRQLTSVAKKDFSKVRNASIA